MNELATLSVPVTEPSAVAFEQNTRVSSLSVFSDNQWNFFNEIGAPSLSKSRKVIHWKFATTGQRHSLEPDYRLMLIALKQLAYLLLFGSQPCKPITLVGRCFRWKVFVRFLAERPYPIFRFQDVLESDLNDYFHHLDVRRGRNQALSPSALADHLAALNALYDHRHELSDYLRYRPAASRAMKQVASVRTQPIADNDLKALIDVALDYLEKRAPRLLHCLEEFHLFAETVRPRPAVKYQPEKDFFARREEVRSSCELNSKLLQLRTACFILIGFSTGMRLSEILATKRGCIRQETTSNHGIFYWIDSKLFKTQKIGSGSDRSWMCGPLAKRAVETLETLGSLLGAPVQTPYLFFAFQHFAAVHRSKSAMIKPLSQNQLGADLKGFCKAEGLEMNLHPHRLRSSFARNIVRFSSTPILVLKDHFKHWSLYMTDWYVGLDPELIGDLEAERRLLSIEAMEKLCTQPVGGPGGRKWKQELEQRIQEGQLPRNFRGKAGLEFRKKMIEDLHSSGMWVTPCSAFAYCVFEKDRALCTQGDRPLVNRCLPFECSNSFILPEHVPALRRQWAELERVYGSLSLEERGAPVGSFYRQQMHKIQEALKPFTQS